MLQKVLKGFPYAADGIRTVALAVDDHVEIDEGVVEALRAKGYVGDPDAGEEATPAVAEADPAKTAPAAPPETQGAAKKPAPRKPAAPKS